MPVAVQMHPSHVKPVVADVAAAGGKVADSYLAHVQMHEKAGYYAVQGLRSVFDYFTGYGAQMNERQWLARFLYLESVAGVPGMVAGMLRHLRSLRTMERDHGWIHTLLEEAENERMHLLTFMQLRNPGLLFRASVIAGQALVFNAYMIAYTLSPKTCHSFVGYLEEEAVKTYTRAINDLDAGKLPKWTDRQAPEIGKFYWRLKPDANMRDLLLAVRADEACHIHVNHTFAHLDADDTNPFSPGSVQLP
ncbi:alternative oxidase [Micractinium conductrix]|uniref:Ubiquinol oxidase n=1 Tax=Micractinium conductrix TaxID=554055 RepID=A0A2P6V0M8_9CHLO|nr:alternative oxidase [Micractinium conductrix]|eukprot:PSC67633.1 alternative oxidase [Micractinium conductrix]